MNNQSSKFLKVFTIYSLISSLSFASSDLDIYTKLNTKLIAQNVDATISSGEVTEMSKKLIKQFQSLIDSTGVKKNESVGSQMSKEQISRFAEYNQKLQVFILRLIIHSRRERDIKLIEELLLINKLYFYGQKSESIKIDPRYIKIYESLLACSKNPNKFQSTGTKDEVTNAWNELLSSTYADYDAESLAKLQSWENEYTKKFGAGNIDLSKLNSDQLMKWEELKSRYQIWSNYFNFLVVLKFFYTTSTLEHYFDISDIDNSVGDIESMGTTLDKIVDKDWNEESKNVHKVLRAVNTLLPSEYELNLANSQQSSLIKK